MGLPERPDRDTGLEATLGSVVQELNVSLGERADVVVIESKGMQPGDNPRIAGQFFGKRSVMICHVAVPGGDQNNRAGNGPSGDRSQGKACDSSPKRWVRRVAPEGNRKTFRNRLGGRT